MPILEWSETQPRVELSTPEEFDHAIERLTARASADRPSIVALYAHGHQVTLGLGLPDSFVQIQESENPNHNPASSPWEMPRPRERSRSISWDPARRRSRAAISFPPRPPEGSLVSS